MSHLIKIPHMIHLFDEQGQSALARRAMEDELAALRSENLKLKRALVKRIRAERAQQPVPETSQHTLH